MKQRQCVEKVGKAYEEKKTEEEGCAYVLSLASLESH